MSGPTPHLSWKELGCRDGTAYPAGWRKTRAVELGVLFERFRAVCGFPLIVLSAYRTPTWNRQRAGARRSQHLEGRALDLARPACWPLGHFHHVAWEFARTNPDLVTGVGYYPWGVHVDTRPGTRFIVWGGSRPFAEVYPKDGPRA